MAANQKLTRTIAKRQIESVKFNHRPNGATAEDSESHQMAQEVFQSDAMRNKYEGHCYKCGKVVKPDDGYFERHKGGWRVQHVACKEKEPAFTSFAEAIAEETIT